MWRRGGDWWPLWTESRAVCAAAPVETPLGPPPEYTPGVGSGAGVTSGATGIPAPAAEASAEAPAAASADAPGSPPSGNTPGAGSGAGVATGETAAPAPLGSHPPWRCPRLRLRAAFAVARSPSAVSRNRTITTTPRQAAPAAGLPAPPATMRRDLPFGQCCHAVPAPPADHQGQRRRLSATAPHLNLDVREEVVGVLDVSDIAGTNRTRRSPIYGSTHVSGSSPQGCDVVSPDLPPPHPWIQGVARVVQGRSAPATRGITVAPSTHDA